MRGPAVQLPFLASHGVNHAQSAQLIWVLCLGIVLVRLYDNLQAKLAIPVVLAVLALAVYRTFNPYTELGFLNSPQVLLTLNLAGNPVLLGRMRAPALRTGGNAHPDCTPGPDVAERLHCAERNHYLRRSHRQGSHRRRALHRHRRLGHRRVLSVFLLLGAAIALGFCTLWSRMARSIAGRGPLEATSRPHLRARLAESELNTKATPSPRSCAGRGSPLYTQHLQQNLRQSLTRNLTRSLQQKYCGYDKAPVQWTGANCRDDRI